MTKISLEIKGLKELQKSFDRYPEVAGREIKKATEKSLNIVHRDSARRAPSDTGLMRSNVRTVAGRTGGILTYRQKYALAVHEGSRPHFPPVKKGRGIALWAKRKGINPYAVAKSIARKGTKPHPFLRKAVESKKGAINRNFDKALDNILKKI